jgi:hypothetical protein
MLRQGWSGLVKYVLLPLREENVRASTPAPQTGTVALCDLWNGAPETGALPPDDTDSAAGAQVAVRKLMRQTTMVLVLVGIGFWGCGSDHAEEVVALQKQVAALTRQVEDLRRQIDSTQEGQQKLRELLSTLEVDVSHLKPRAPSQPAQAIPTEKDLTAPAVSGSPQIPERMAKVSCPQVWQLLGKGNDEATVAQSLGTTEAAVQACERQIGQGKKRR